MRCRPDFLIKQNAPARQDLSNKMRFKPEFFIADE
jgi:hypothetical protein